MNKTALRAISTTTTTAVSVMIASAFIDFPTASTSEIVFAGGYTKNMSNITDQTTANPFCLP
jgi:hypothetical protein